MTRVNDTRSGARPRRARDSGPERSAAPLAAIARLQRTVGNRAVGHLLQRDKDEKAAPSQQAPPPPKPVINVRKGSKLTAAQFVARLKRSRKLPSWLKSHLVAKGDQISLSGALKPPSNTILEFVEGFEKAFAAGNWTITTGTAKIEVTEDADKKQKWTQRVIPDLAGDEIGDWVKMDASGLTFSPRSIFLTTPGVQYGQTMETATKRDQAEQRMIVITTRIEVTNPKKKKRTFTPDAENVAESFLHEISAHAGELAEKRSADHGTPRVERLSDEIGGLFRPTVSGQLQPSKITQQVLAFVGPEGGP